MPSKFLSAEWRKLAIANYAVDPHLLRPYLPFGTELDTWQGKHYISLVGFRFLNTRLKGFAVPFHRHFEEVNLRFYVRRKEGNDWKRGVTFIREIVPKRALSVIANLVYGEKYITRQMAHTWNYMDELLEISYSWKSGTNWNRFSIVSENKAKEIVEGSEEEFVTEHYWGYTPLNKSSCTQYQVAHPKWMVYRVKEWKIEVDFGAVYGRDFDFLSGQVPDSVMLAEGSEIEVFSSTRIRT